ncbi:helix-turn-helix transcriptional regulator [Pseudomonas sp. TH49]|uniref:helix-turn-helix domain-containing protein n=1 Tax=Pseudomonas sp. TH49 TaxID=2796413 RepID=UPI001912B215|nr:helix-turn-helix transcriptional regulator [Pseudomonas sp. TH49]MBK5343134.1 helix-turn-helix transcriptional regulator [Pseudomonas sp. TH49]
MPTKHALAEIIERLHTNQRGFEEALQGVLTIVEKFGGVETVERIRYTLEAVQDITSQIDHAYTQASVTRNASKEVVGTGPSTIGSRLREERVKLKMTQQHFGAVGGVNIDAQFKYERGIRIPKADYLANINPLGADIYYIVTGRRLAS